MKRRFSTFLAALALLAFMTPCLVGWGQTRSDVTLQYTGSTTTNMTGNNDATILGLDATAWSVVGAKGGSNNFPGLNKSHYIALYYASSGSNTITVSNLGNNTISSIVITYTGANYNNGKVLVNGSEVTGTDGSYNINANSFVVTNGNTSNIQVRISSIVITYTNGGGQPSTYTVTYDANGGTGTMTDSDSPYNAGATVTVLDNEFTRTGYTFDHWNTAADDSGTSYDEGDEFTINANTTLYAQWTENSGGSTITATLTQSNLELTGSYTTGTEKTIDGITYVYTDLMKNNSNIQAKATTGTIKNSTPYPGDIISVVITHSGTARATTINGSMDGTNWTQVATGSGSITADFSGMGYKYFQITRGANAAYWEKIDIIYSAHASTQSESDLAITNASTDFTFDLYNNSTAQVINYTTSSTGAITITPASPTSYFSYVHDATAKTITVTPLAVTPSAQSVTISQEADENYYPGTTTFTVSVVNSDPNVPGTQNNPYTVAQARAAIDANSGVTGVYATGIVSENNYFSSNNGYITYFISADGSTESDQLEAFHGMNFNGAVFTSANEIQVGDSVVIYGNLMKYHDNNTNTDVYEFASGNQLVFLERPNQYTLTAAMTNVAEYFVFVEDDEIEFDANNQTQVRAGTTVYVSLTMEDCYALTSLTVNGSTTGVTEEEPGVYYSFVMPEGDATIGVSATQATEYTLTVVGAENVTFDMLAGAESNSVSLTNGTATLCEQTFVTIANLSANSGLILQSVTLTAGGSTTPLTLENGVYHFTMPSSNATLTFTTATAPTYTLVNSIVSGKSYIISNGEDRAMGAQSGNIRSAATVSIDDNVATATSEDVYEFVITGSAEDGYTIYDVKAGGYLYASSSNSNVIGTRDENSDNNSMWTIDFDGSAVTISANGTNTRNYIRYNYNNGNDRFSCYASNSSLQEPLYLYVKDETPATETYTLENITGYTGEKDHYYLIASPVTVDPATVEGMTEDDFDLYYFDQSEEDEWINYETANGVNPSFGNLVPGKGYLYAKKATNDNSTYSFELTGTPYSGNGEIGLDYDDNAEFPGFNLIGNPFGTNVTLNMPYYRLNSDRSGLNTSTENTEINVMEGVFVQATAEIQTATFSTGAKRVNQLNIKVTRNRGTVLDNAIIRFDNGATLGKFQINQNSTKLYITEGNQDYAVVCSNNEGEMPFNFKAAENGNYTLSVDAENVEVSYLHLIDNMNNADIDLLATPSYSFDARTTDNANRFRLVFNTNGVDENTTTASFAYFNGSEWTISNMGEATLQVVDMMGRVLSTQAISGNTEVSISQVPGVYMLRLINGENVMVQKVVVR